MELQVLNGTNSVGMNGTNNVGMNGTNSVGMNGTNSVVLQGRNGRTLTMNGLSFLTSEDVPMDGCDDCDSEDAQLYRLGYMYGDRAALNGFKAFKAKLAAKKEARQEKRADRKEEKAANKASKKVVKQARRDRNASGQGFFQKAGGFLENIGQAQKIAAEASKTLADLGIDPNEEIVDERAALAADDGYLPEKSGSGGGLGGWWNERSTGEKIAMGAGGALLLGGGIYLATRKKGKKRK